LDFILLLLAAGGPMAGSPGKLRLTTEPPEPEESASPFDPSSGLNSSFSTPTSGPLTELWTAAPLLAETCINVCDCELAGLVRTQRLQARANGIKNILGMGNLLLE
jgi:hypothetical protein